MRESEKGYIITNAHEPFMGIFICIRTVSYKDFPGGPLADSALTRQGAGQGTRSHMPQLKIPYFTTETWHNQRNKY